MYDDYHLDGDEDFWLYVKHPTQDHHVSIHIIVNSDGIMIDAWKDEEVETLVATIGTPRKPVNGNIARGVLAWDDETGVQRSVTFHQERNIL